MRTCQDLGTTSLILPGMCVCVCVCVSISPHISLPACRSRWDWWGFPAGCGASRPPRAPGWISSWNPGPCLRLAGSLETQSGSQCDMEAGGAGRTIGSWHGTRRRACVHVYVCVLTGNGHQLSKHGCIIGLRLNGRKDFTLWTQYVAQRSIKHTSGCGRGIYAFTNRQTRMNIHWHIYMYMHLGVYSPLAACGGPGVPGLGPWACSDTSTSHWEPWEERPRDSYPEPGERWPCRTT